MKSKLDLTKENKIVLDREKDEKDKRRKKLERDKVKRDRKKER
jgi:hypothetical protein